MQQIKVIVSKTLIEERSKKLNDSLLVLENIEDQNKLIENFLVISSKLIEEGYTLQEIESSDIYKQLNNVNWSGVLGDSILNTAKEFIIKFVLQEVLGANATFSRMFAQFMANVNPIDLLKPFKDEANCVQHFPQIVDGILIVMFRSIAAGEFGVDSNSYSIVKGGLSAIAGNMLGQVIKESDISEKVSGMFCKTVH